MKENAAKQKAKQEKIDHAKQKLEEQMEHMRQNDKKKRFKLSVFFIISYSDLETSDKKDLAMFKSLRDDLDKHESEMTKLKQEEDVIQKDLLEKKMELIKLEISSGKKKHKTTTKVSNIRLICKSESKYNFSLPEYLITK